ncbi:HEAT repeat domain-containing protein [Prosthecobacter sp.]|uniref:HEAT repeat domain-containing protein n=1 Tax=Prosthecobacter sp. TaxID=1965333 RepID=UPI003783E116
MGVNRNHLIAALLFIFVPCLVLKWNWSPSPAFASILAKVRHECDPDNPDADYYLRQGSMPTERNREAIIEECRRKGGELLPEVQRQIAQEKDYEVRGMLTVIAAALGDNEAVEKAAREMAWSDYPAVRISAAKTLRRLKDRRTIEWFVTAMQDDHFVVNGACGTLREQFYPVRSIAQVALRDMMGSRYPGDDQVQKMSRAQNGGSMIETAEEREIYLKEVQRKYEEEAGVRSNGMEKKQR